MNEHPYAKLTQEQKSQAFAMRAQGYSDAQIMQTVGIPPLSQASASLAPREEPAENMTPSNAPTDTPPNPSMPKRIMNALNTGADAIVNTVYDFGTGAAQGLVDIANIPQNLIRRGINKVAGKEVAPLVNIDVEEWQPGGPVQNPYLKQMGEIGSVLATPMGEIKLAAQALSKAPKLFQASKAARLGAGAADIGATGAAYGAAFGAGNDESLADNATQGAYANMLLAPFFRTIPALRNAYIQNKAAKARQGGSNIRTPQEVAEYSERIGDLPVDFGTLTNSPTARDVYKNWLSAIPFSGAKNNMQKVISATDQEAENILNHFAAGMETGEIPYRINQEIASNLERNEANVSEKFTKISEQSDAANIFFNENPETQAVARKYLDKYEEAVRANKTPSISKADADELKRIIGGVPAGQNVRFDIADAERSAFGDLKRLHKKDSNQYLSSMYKELEGAAKKDIQSTFDRAKQPALKKDWRDALREHAVTVLPYRRGVINNLLQGNSNVENIANVVSLPQHKRILNDLSDVSRRNVAHELLTKNLPQDLTGSMVPNATRITNQFAKTRPGTQQRIYTPEETENLRRLQALNDIAKEYRPILNTPQTGALLKNLAVGGTALALPALGAIAGYRAGDDDKIRNALLYGLVAATSIPASKRAVNSLTNPMLRKDYIKGRHNMAKKTRSQEEAARKIAISQLTD